MLFLLKRRWETSLAALVVLTALGWGLRHLLAAGPAFAISWRSTGLGIGALGVVLASDAITFVVLSLTFGKAFRCRFREFTELFQNQTFTAMMAGALLAGLGEELVFRGIATDPLFLTALAVLFGLLHHVRRSLWPFTLWSIYEGLLFAVAVYLTGSLWVTMVAHFLHDLGGFLAIRLWFNRSK
jgi:membrane protease YdiL (CAAX protease family)